MEPKHVRFDYDMVDRDGFVPTRGRRTRGGEPVQRFQKAIMRVGEYTTGDGTRFKVTKSHLSRWVSQFKKMKKNEVRVPIPASHERTDADDNRGFVQSMFVDGDRLIMQADVIGDDAIRSVSRSDVSVFMPPTFRDGKGNDYGNYPITHVALTPTPVVPGLGDFISIAASLKGNPGTENPEMKFEKIAKAMGVEPDKLTADTAEAVICAAFGKHEDALKVVEGEKLKLAEELKTTAKGTEKEEDVPALHPATIKMAAETRKERIDLLVEQKVVSPAAAKILTDAFVGEENRVIAASLANVHVVDSFDDVVRAFKEARPVDTTEKTGPQSFALPKDADGKAVNPLQLNADKRAKAAAIASA